MNDETLLAQMERRRQERVWRLAMVAATLMGDQPWVKESMVGALAAATKLLAIADEHIR